DALHLFDVLIADAFAAAVAALQAVQDVLPHGPGRLQPLGPVAAALELPLEAPHAGEALGAQEAALLGLGVGGSPLDLHRRRPCPGHGGGPRTVPGPAAVAWTSAAPPASRGAGSPARPHAVSGAAPRWGPAGWCRGGAHRPCRRRPGGPARPGECGSGGCGPSPAGTTAACSPAGAPPRPRR